MSNRNKVEAVLFALGRDVAEEDLARLAGVELTETRTILETLQNHYNQDGSNALFVRKNDNFWKFTIKDNYLALVSELVTNTDLDKPVMETLAVIAWNHPALQSDIIKIRHTKAYDHMKQLEDAGFVQKVKFGRTYKIKLTPKFFDYFDIPSQNAKDAFKKVVPPDVQEQVMQMEQEIEDKEKESEHLRQLEEEQKVKLAEQRKQEKSAEQEAEEAAEQLEKELAAYDETEENSTSPGENQDAEETNQEQGSQQETVYVCEGECGGVATKEEHDHGATTCAAQDCSKHGEPLVKKARCTKCGAVYDEGESHQC